MKTAVVVGGGIAGIYSAILLKSKYEDVYLIEKEDHLGGLLRSFQNEHGDWFDYGTHFIAGTDIQAINNTILDEQWTNEWSCFENEKGGNFFNGQLSENCLFVNAKEIGNNYYQGLSEFLEIINDDRDYHNAEEQLEKTFGYTFAHEIFIPALCKLFCVDNLQGISVDSHLRFGMKRLRALNQEATTALKSVPSYDDRLCHHEFSIGSAARVQYYPKNGGAGRWIEKFESLLRTIGVKIICGQSVIDIEHQGDTIQEVKLSNGERIQCESLVWTIPLAFLFKAAKVECLVERPDLINTTLLHYVFDTPPIPDSHFFFCYDPNFSPFRVTLYSNLQVEEALNSGRHRITVEVLSNKTPDLESLLPQVLNELVDMKVIKESYNCLYQGTTKVSHGFPVLSNQFAIASKDQYLLAKNKFNNLYIEGRNNTKDWFMTDVFKAVYKDFG